MCCGRACLFKIDFSLDLTCILISPIYIYSLFIRLNLKFIYFWYITYKWKKKIVWLELNKEIITNKKQMKQKTKKGVEYFLKKSAQQKNFRSLNKFSNKYLKLFLNLIRRRKRTLPDGQIQWYKKLRKTWHRQTPLELAEIQSNHFPAYRGRSSSHEPCTFYIFFQCFQSIGNHNSCLF